MVCKVTAPPDCQHRTISRHNLNHCREGLGEEFLDAIDLAFAEVIQRPMTWRILNGRFRRYLVHHNPYAVIYAVEDETIYVAAIMHMRRKPDYWHDRVR